MTLEQYQKINEPLSKKQVVELLYDTITKYEKEVEQLKKERDDLYQAIESGNINYL